MMQCLVLLGTLLAVVGLAQEESPVRWSFAAPAFRGQAVPGGVLQVKITAGIREGWHLYSLKPIEGGPVPTRITLPEGQPFSLDGEIDVPPPIVEHDPVFDTQVEYYAESAEFELPVRIAAAARPGPQKLTVAARFQACNQKLCLPPRTVKMDATVNVAAR